MSCDSRFLSGGHRCDVLSTIDLAIVARIEATAEEVCDDHAVQFGPDRQSYAELLVVLAERTLLVPPSVAVPLVTFRSLLGRRVGASSIIPAGCR